MRVSIIDIGSNTIRHMDVAKTPDGVVYGSKQVFTTRLAQGLSRTGGLSQESMTATLSVIRQLSDTARENRAAVFAYATSAVRDAKNKGAFKTAVENLTGSPLRLLTGFEEALLARIAATRGVGGFLEIGGGSTQLSGYKASRSYQMGCVRAKDLCPRQPYADVMAALTPHFDRIFVDLPQGCSAYTGAGGTVTTLTALSLGLNIYQPALVQGATLTPDRVEELLSVLGHMPENEILSVPLLSRRHDVIVQGGAILLYLMRKLNIHTLTASDRDGMDEFARLSVMGCESGLEAYCSLRDHAALGRVYTFSNGNFHDIGSLYNVLADAVAHWHGQLLPAHACTGPVSLVENTSLDLYFASESGCGRFHADPCGNAAVLHLYSLQGDTACMDSAARRLEGLCSLHLTDCGEDAPEYVFYAHRGE